MAEDAEEGALLGSVQQAASHFAHWVECQQLLALLARCAPGAAEARLSRALTHRLSPSPTDPPAFSSVVAELPLHARPTSASPEHVCARFEGARCDEPPLATGCFR